MSLKLYLILVLIVVGLCSFPIQSQAITKNYGFKPGDRYDIVESFEQVYFDGFEETAREWTADYRIRVIEISNITDQIEYYLNDLNGQVRLTESLTSWGSYFVYADWIYWPEYLISQHGNSPSEGYRFWDTGCTFNFISSYESLVEENVGNQTIFTYELNEFFYSYNLHDGVRVRYEEYYFLDVNGTFIETITTYELAGATDCSPVENGPNVIEETLPQLQGELRGLNPEVLLVILTPFFVVGGGMVRKRIKT